MILPGSTVKVIDENSIYRGYVGCVQRIQGKKAAVLMDQDGTPWDKMITFKISVYIISTFPCTEMLICNNC